MTRGHVAARKEASGVLPTGGNILTANALRGDKTVDKSNALPWFKKKPGSQAPRNSDIFKPIEPNQNRPTTKGKDLHTDPFAPDRAHFQPAPKKLLHVHVDEPHKQGIRLVKPVVHEHPKNELVTANGLIFHGGKLSNKNRYVSTLNNDQPAKDYSHMLRFRQEFSLAHRSTNHVVSHEREQPEAPKDYVQSHHGGIRSNPDRREVNSQSLIGVLRPDVHKPTRQFTYRPPWGTCNTPRTPPTSRNVAHATPTPWAVGNNFRGAE